MPGEKRKRINEPQKMLLASQGYKYIYKGLEGHMPLHTKFAARVNFFSLTFPVEKAEKN